MLTLRRGQVTAIRERRPGLVRLEVDGRPCIAFPRLTGPVGIGDDVVVNTQALDLGLGSGGFDILHVNLSRGLGLPADPGAHVMKLPYTSLQHAVPHAEETTELPSSLTGMPVVACTLHSQVAAVCAAIGRERQTAYVQLPGGALPVSFSDTIHALRRAGLVATTIAVGPCFDGDAASVSVASALAFAKGCGLDVAVCAIGPGIVGTATPLGHGALAVVEALAATISLGGRPILAPRVSSVDPRPRHRGISHHTRAVLELAPEGVAVAWPAGLPGAAEIPGSVELDVTGWERVCTGLPLSTMGRGPNDDPWFFAAAYAAGRLAARRLEEAPR